MTEQIVVSPTGPVVGTIQPPGSKSITNRALVCAAIAEGPSILEGALVSEDTHVMLESLVRLGIEVQSEQNGTLLKVAGCGGKIPAASADLFVANSGTTIRFLTAMVALGHGKYRLDGIARMRQRPIADLLQTMNDLGVEVVSELGTGAPPVMVHAKGLRGGTAKISGEISSQFLSGLLMAAPLAQQDVCLQVIGELVSKPYVTMTLNVMQAFGAESQSRDFQEFRIPGRQIYRGCHYQIEPDASAASYFWGAAAVSGGKVTVKGLQPDALQGDVAFVNCLKQMGCEVTSSAEGITVVGKPLRGIDIDMNAISDTVQTLAVVALFAEGPTTMRGVGHIRHKETDRIGDLARELRKLGAQVDEWEDGLRVHPAPLHGATLETYNDHRMAMSFSLAGLRVPDVVILNPGCTAKTYPGYFDDLARLCAANA
ncbi:MAG: 3-phosphoshikimate 1-carboxyvinyltransferase [Planctomycetaceae bacterium]